MCPLRTLFLFSSSIILFLNSQKNHYYSSKPALLFSLSCGRNCRSFSFWLGDITQIIKNWKHWLRIQNIPVSHIMSFEKATKACVLSYYYGQLYMWLYCCIQFHHDALLRNLLPVGPPKMNVIKMPPHLLLFRHYSHFWMLTIFSKLFQHNLRRPIAS